VAWVDGFDLVSNSAQNHVRLPAQHSKLCISAYHNHQPPQKHEQDNKGGNGWWIHPFSQKVCCLLDTIMTKSKLCRIQVVSHIPPPSKMSVHVHFWWWLIVLQHHHPTILKNECACLFSMVVGCPSLPPLKMSVHACF